MRNFREIGSLRKEFPSIRDQQRKVGIQTASEIRSDLIFENYGSNNICYHVCLACFGPFFYFVRKQEQNSPLLELSALPQLKMNFIHMCKFTDGVWCLYVTLLVSSPARSPALEIIISLYFLVIMKVAARLSGLRMNVRESQYRSVINRGIRTNRKKLMDISMTTVKMACVMR